MTSIATDVGGGTSADTLSQKIDDAGNATKDLVDKLKAIGPPETQAGEQAKSEIDQFADTTSSRVDSIKATAQSLGSADVAGFTAGISKIASDLSAVVQSAQTTLNNIEQLDPQGELSSAIKNNETCQSLTGATS